MDEYNLDSKKGLLKLLVETQYKLTDLQDRYAVIAGALKDLQERFTELQKQNSTYLNKIFDLENQLEKKETNKE